MAEIGAHGFVSTTSTITEYYLDINGRHYRIIDTPGLDDSAGRDHFHAMNLITSLLSVVVVVVSKLAIDAASAMISNSDAMLIVLPNDIILLLLQNYSSDPVRAVVYCNLQ